MNASTAIHTGRQVMLALSNNQQREVAKFVSLPNRKASSLSKKTKYVSKAIHPRNGLNTTSSNNSNNVRNGGGMRNPAKLRGMSGPGLEINKMSRNAAAATSAAAAVAVKPLIRRNVVDAPETHNNHQVTFDKSFSDHFELGVLLGQGKQGMVYEATNKKTGETVAVKALTKSDVAKVPNGLKRLKAEATFLSNAQKSPFSVSYYGAYEDETYVYIVMEQLKGGSIDDSLQKEGRFNEELTAKVIYDVMSFLKTMHEDEVCYGDIKPQNFMLTGNLGTSMTKAVDFGCCQKVIKGRRFRNRTGTPLYMAPEVQLGNFGVESDVWSAGVMLYQLLSGALPFVKINARGRIMDMGVHLGFSFENEVWEKVSDNAKDLISKMLIRDKSTRITAQDALKHPFFNSLSNANKVTKKESHVSSVVPTNTSSSSVTKPVSITSNIVSGPRKNFPETTRVLSSPN